VLACGVARNDDWWSQKRVVAGEVAAIALTGEPVPLLEVEASIVLDVVRRLVEDALRHGGEHELLIDVPVEISSANLSRQVDLERIGG
jgi:hypothetical protein